MVSAARTMGGGCFKPPTPPLAQPPCPAPAGPAAGLLAHPSPPLSSPTASSPSALPRARPPEHPAAPPLAPPAAQKSLPLAIRAVQPCSATFADLAPFPPSPVAPGTPPPAGAAALRFTLQFESSGKWPDNLDAIATLRTAFYLRLATLLEAQTDAICEVSADGLYVQSGGFTFVGSIVHEPSIRLLHAAGMPSAATSARQQVSARTPRHPRARPHLLVHLLAHLHTGPVTRGPQGLQSAQNIADSE